MLKLINRASKLAVLAGAAIGAAYLTSAAFAERWKSFVVEQLAEREVHVDFRSLTVDPFRGLVARDAVVFNDSGREQVLAAVERMHIDFDVGRLIEGELKVEALTLRDTALALPVDPQDPASEKAQMTGLNARVFLMEDRLDIRQAEGELAGVRLSVTGSLVLPKKKEPRDPKDDPKENAARRMEFIRRNRSHIQQGLRWLERFQFAQKPSVAVELDGYADKLQNIEARLTLSARGVESGGYRCEDIDMQARYSGGFIDLTRLHLRDATGTLDASGGWQMGGEEVKFRLSSSADLPGLAAAFLHSEALREVVFYEPPSLSLDGTWFVGPSTKAKTARPVSALGQLSCGRVASRGEIFDGLSLNFGVTPEGFYVRDGLLRHKSGTLGFQAMDTDSGPLKFRALLKMDPRAFLPFVQKEKTREAISRFDFRDSSTIFLQLDGEGPGPALTGLRSAGRAELRDFTYRGTEIASAEGRVEFSGPEQVFSAITVTRHDGSGEAGEVRVNNQEGWVRLTGIKGSLDHVAITNCFAPKTAQHIARYKLPPSTAVELGGTIGTKKPDLNDLTISFRTPGGTGRYPLWGKEYEIGSPAGQITVKQDQLGYDVSGQLHSKPMRARGTVRLGAESAPEYTVQLTAGSFPYSVFGKNLPFENATADVKAKGSQVEFDVKSSLLAGQFSLKGSLDTASKPEKYRGELKVDAVSFRRFAQTYSPGYETEGDLSGYFEFAGRLDDWQALRGSGVGIIVNGNLYAVPVIGPLTPMLGSILPGPVKGYNVAKSANCTYRVENGLLTTHDFEAMTGVFRLVSKGRVDFIHDSIDFEAQARVRGIPGLVLLPVSHLLEYKADGTISDPKWKPWLFSMGGGKKENDRPQPANGSDNEPPASGNGGGSGSSKGNLLRKLLPFGGGKAEKEKKE